MKGWTGKILVIDLSSGNGEILNSADYTEKFIGGRGFASKIYWDEAGNNFDAFHPSNPLMLMPGPLGGTPAFAGSRWVISGKSPLLYPDQFSLGNVGGSFGSGIKSAGFDGIVITGKCKSPSYLHIENEKYTLKDAKGLWGLTTDETLQKIEKTHSNKSKSLCIGPAGEKKIRFAIAMSDRGACGGGGFGAVMGAKNLKAVVIAGNGKPEVAKPEELKAVNNKILSLIKGRELIGLETAGTELVKKTPCPGCPSGCPRGILKHVSGREEYRKNCQSSFMYFLWDQKYNKGESTPNTFIATSLCNRFGLDTHEMGSIIHFLNKCYEKGLLNDGNSGLKLSEIGSLEFIENLVQMILSREGIGDLLAEGTRRAAGNMGKDYEGLLDSFLTSNGRDANFYNPRFFLTNSIFYATESTSIINQLHEICMPMMKWVMWFATNGAMSPVSTEVMQRVAKKFWGSESAVDFSTYEGKANVARIIQDREYAKENLVVCDFLYPLTVAEGAEDLVGDSSLESSLLSAVTGLDYDEEKYYLTGERVFNLQRAIQCREGWKGGRDDIINKFNFSEKFEESAGFFGMFNPDFMLPGPEGELISRKGSVVDRDEFKNMIREYYELRGWDRETGFQKEDKLVQLGLSEIVPEIKKKGMIIT